MEQAIEIFSTERQKLYERLSDKLETIFQFNRKFVSFQANKDEPVYRLFKYKEGFSSNLVKYFLTEYAPKPGKILDLFAGAGTTLFAGQELGWQSYGIELLPVGIFVMHTREAFNNIDINALKHTIDHIWNEIEKITAYDIHLEHITITKDAFPVDSEVLLNKYLTLCSTIPDKHLQTILRFAGLSILEEISYTRKDGQYLRWDYRSKRELPGKPYDIGDIIPFTKALKNKLNQIVADCTYDSPSNLFDFNEADVAACHPVRIIQGSCLEEMPKLESDFFDFIITSPPYCNRYDYTRTYALELVYLGYNHEQVRNLRQSMLSCTVENKEKYDYLHDIYALHGNTPIFDEVMAVYNNSEAMLEVNSTLNELNKLGRLNNNNIPRMVRNYFLELCFVIYEMARVLKPGGYCVMVNDNVRYGGEEVPVDLILSEFAEKFGLTINKIMVLPRGKGNSSQQMGSYGRTEVRKCVYLWQKI